MKTITATVTILIDVKYDEKKTTSKKILESIAEGCDYKVAYVDRETKTEITETELIEVMEKK